MLFSQDLAERPKFGRCAEGTSWSQETGEGGAGGEAEGESEEERERTAWQEREGRAGEEGEKGEEGAEEAGDGWVGAGEDGREGNLEDRKARAGAALREATHDENWVVQTWKRQLFYTSKDWAKTILPKIGA